MYPVISITRIRAVHQQLPYVLRPPQLLRLGVRHALFPLLRFVLGYFFSVFAGISSASKIMSLQYEVDRKARDISERKLVAMEQERTISELQNSDRSGQTAPRIAALYAPHARRSVMTKVTGEQLGDLSGTPLGHGNSAHAICPDCASRLYPDHYRGGTEG